MNIEATPFIPKYLQKLKYLPTTKPFIPQYLQDIKNMIYNSKFYINPESKQEMVFVSTARNIPPSKY